MSALKRGVPDRKARRTVERAWAIGDLKGIFQKDGKEYVK